MADLIPGIPDALIELSSNDARLLYLAIRAACDDTGTCRNAVYVAAVCGVPPRDIRAVLDELQRHGLIRIGRSESEYGGHQTDCQLTNWVPALRLDRLSSDAWNKLRDQVFRRDGHRCVYCRASNVALECDHVDPLSAGGTNEIGNLVTACSDCNRSKRDKRLEQWRGRVHA